MIKMSFKRLLEEPFAQPAPEMFKMSLQEPPEMDLEGLGYHFGKIFDIVFDILIFFVNEILMWVGYHT